MSHQSANRKKWRKILSAYAVHSLTASGAVCGLLAIEAISHSEVRMAFIFMLSAVIVDAIDGTLARAVDVRTHTPWIDGTLLDGLVDFLTYAIVPAYFVVTTELLDQALRWPLATLILLASAFQFSHQNAKTSDHYFLGFPSYWNIVVFYFSLLSLPQSISLALILFFSLLSLLPIRFVYPTRLDCFGTSVFEKHLFIALTALWGVSILLLLYRYPQPSAFWLTISLLYVLYYFLVSIKETIRLSRNERTCATGNSL